MSLRMRTLGFDRRQPTARRVDPGRQACVAFRACRSGYRDPIACPPPWSSPGQEELRRFTHPPQHVRRRRGGRIIDTRHQAGSPRSRKKHYSMAPTGCIRTHHRVFPHSLDGTPACDPRPHPEVDEAYPDAVAHHRGLGPPLDGPPLNRVVNGNVVGLPREPEAEAAGDSGPGHRLKQGARAYETRGSRGGSSQLRSGAG